MFCAPVLNSLPSTHSNPLHECAGAQDLVPSRNGTASRLRPTDDPEARRGTSHRWRRQRGFGGILDGTLNGDTRASEGDQGIVIGCTITRKLVSWLRQIMRQKQSWKETPNVKHLECMSSLNTWSRQRSLIGRFAPWNCLDHSCRKHNSTILQMTCKLSYTTFPLGRSR